MIFLVFILRPPLSQTRSSVSIPPTMEQIANLLDCISWSGVGPVLMDAATKVALHSTQKKKSCFTSGKTSGWSREL